MKTVAIISEKGGVGKTTLSINLGVAAALKNKVVAIIDLDPQSSSAAWGDLRGADTPTIIATPASRLNNVIETAKEEGFDLLILDTAPRAEATVLNAAKAADLILIPCCPSLFDIKALKNTIDLIKLAKKTATFVLTLVPTSGTVGEESAQALKAFEFPLCPIKITTKTKEVKMFKFIQNKVTNSRERSEKIEKMFKNFQHKFNNLMTEFENLKKESLKEICELETENSHLKTENSHLRNQLLQQKENQSAVYDPKEKKPQHYNLSKTFEKLRDDFQYLSDKLYTCCHDSDFKKNRRDTTAKIKSVLSEEILVNAMKRVTANSQNITAEQNQEICRVIIKEHLEKLGWKSDEKKGFPEQDCLELIKEGFKLVKDMASLNPPGRLVWYEKGEEFNKDKHEARQGSDEKGKISLIMHPGYMEGDKVTVKAWVLTN